MRLQKIDSGSFRDHYYLEPSDHCYYVGEFTPYGGYSCSPTNQLIHNLKKSVSLKGTPQYVYKGKAIAEAGGQLRKVLNIHADAFRQITFVPIPPSKAKTDPEYDDRMVQVLRHMGAGVACDIRELVVQTNSTQASHRSEQRLKPAELEQLYSVDVTLQLPTPTNIGIVDDVLTAGAHYRAMKTVLGRHFPGVPIFGLFLARSKRDADVWDDEEAI
ncbi:hypothetical protein ACOTEK_24230 [Achromobacter xylosoxidans]